MPRHERSSAWSVARMETLSWVNMFAGLVFIGSALFFDLPAWSFWTAIVVGATIIVLEIFDEWAEARGLAQEVVGPEAVVLVASLWLAGTVLVTGGPAAFVAIGFVGGLLVAVTSAANLVSSFRMDETSEYEDRAP